MAQSLEELRRRFPDAPTAEFGDSRALSDTLIALIRQGKKRATCAALAEFEREQEPLPHVGLRQIVVGWDGEPVLVIETTEVTLRRFCDVDARFALAEGEVDTLESWRDQHRAYFERNGGFAPDMVLVCERFEVVCEVEQG